MKRQMVGEYTDEQAPGALPNGTRIVKVFTEPGDTNPVGTTGKVLGSIGPVPLPDFVAAKFVTPEDGLDFGYWVEWDKMPDVAVFIISRKIRRAQ